MLIKTCDRQFDLIVFSIAGIFSETLPSDNFTYNQV
jgi:hypothetical protein